MKKCYRIGIKVIIAICLSVSIDSSSHTQNRASPSGATNKGNVMEKRASETFEVKLTAHHLNSNFTSFKFCEADVYDLRFEKRNLSLPHRLCEPIASLFLTQILFDLGEALVSLRR